MQASPDFRVAFERCVPAVWDTLPQTVPRPLQQHMSYGYALAQLGGEIWQISVFHQDQRVAIALVSSRRLFGVVRITTMLRGPVWIDPDTPPGIKTAAFTALRKNFSRWRWNFLILQPELPDTPETTAILRRAGLRRVMTGYTTMWVDLRPKSDDLRSNLAGKWRNQLRKAEQVDLSISLGGRKPHQYVWLTEKEDAQRTDRGYQALPTGFVRLFAEADTQGARSGVLSVTAMKGREKVAGALFLLHGNSATYHIGWVGEEGRRINAQNRVLWEAILALKERSISFLDLGGIETATQAGIARFKLGLGAPPITFTGTWA